MFTVGGAASNHMKAGLQTTASGRFNDGVATDLANTAVGDLNVPDAGDLILVASARDQGNEAYAYAWNFTQNVQIWLKTTAAGATSDQITPTANTAGLSDWKTFYGAIAFEFAGGALPSTWKEDMKAMSTTLVNSKS